MVDDVAINIYTVIGHRTTYYNQDITIWVAICIIIVMIRFTLVIQPSLLSNGQVTHGRCMTVHGLSKWFMIAISIIQQ